MTLTTLIITASLFLGVQPGKQAARAQLPATTADRLVLREGKAVLGLVTLATNGPRSYVEMLVRRDWAETHVPEWTKRQDRANLPEVRRAARLRRERLLAWRQMRSEFAPAGDPILAWIVREWKRLDDPSALARSPLIPVRVARTDIRGLTRQSVNSGRLLQLGWLCRLPEVEGMSPDDLRDALEVRGLNPDGKDMPSLAPLLPIALESEPQWLARKAATEVSVDQDLRFIRYNDLILPDRPAEGGGFPPIGLDVKSMLGEIGKLLDPNPQARTDPLAESLKGKVAGRGRVGAVVTRLEVSPDLDRVSVESTLWVHAGDGRFLPSISRTSVIRPEELGPEAGQGLAADPQVEGAFRLVEQLGLGAIPRELKERSLKMGAATQKALGIARSALEQELDTLRLPILEPAQDEPPARPAR